MGTTGTGPTRRGRVWAALSRREGVLWGLVVASMLADLLLTYHGVENGLRESNPVANAALERFGYAALGTLKLFAIGVGLACRPLLPREYVAVVPLGLAIPWVVASLINVGVIYTALY